MKFQQWQRVFIRPSCSNDLPPALGVIERVGEVGEAICIHIVNPPEWQRLMLRKRGIFISEHSELWLNLFKDHDLSWTDIQTFEHFEIEDAERTIGFAEEVNQL